MDGLSQVAHLATKINLKSARACRADANVARGQPSGSTPAFLGEHAAAALKRHGLGLDERRICMQRHHLVRFKATKRMLRLKSLILGRVVDAWVIKGHG